MTRASPSPPPQSLYRAVSIVPQGEENRAIAEHQLNTMSSRSHAVVTLYLETRRSPVDPQSITSKMHLIDLAGSEVRDGISLILSLIHGSDGRDAPDRPRGVRGETWHVHGMSLTVILNHHRRCLLPVRLQPA